MSPYRDILAGVFRENYAIERVKVKPLLPEDYAIALAVEVAYPQTRCL